jgi:hypothetical protein
MSTSAGVSITARPVQPEYFTAYSSLKMARDAQGVLVVEFTAKVDP